MNADKLKNLSVSVRTGGKGSVRRKKLIKPRASATSDKNLNQILGRLQCTPWSDVEEITLFHTDQTTTVFTKPTIQANFGANLFIVRGTHVNHQNVESNETTVLDDAPELIEDVYIEDVAPKVSETSDFEAFSEGNN